MRLSDKFKFGVINLDSDVHIAKDRIQFVVGAVAKTSELTHESKDFLLNNKDKIILHYMTSGLGETPVEPSKLSYDHIFDDIKYLLDRGFPEYNVILDLYPIFPEIWIDIINEHLNADYLDMLKDILTKAEYFGIKRIRYDILKMIPDEMNHYYNIDNRLVIPETWAYDPENEIQLISINDKISYESLDFFNPYTEHINMISNKDLLFLKLNDRFVFTNYSNIEVM